MNGSSNKSAIKNIQLLTVASFIKSASFDPREAKPISCENWAKFLSASIGIWPKISWQQSGSGV